jgi:hypothetical protein
VEALVARLLSKDPLQRPPNGEEAAVVMRALIPIAEAAPAPELAEPVEDPVPVFDPAHPSEPPEMLPPPVDPLLERAMLGDVAPDVAERRFRVPRWAAFVPRRWWPYALVSFAAAIGLVTAALLFRAGSKPRPVPVVAVATPAPQAQTPPAAPAVTETQAPAPAAAQPAAAERDVARPTRLTQLAASPYAKNFDRAQKALWTNRPAGAQTILRDVLKKPGLSRRDRARASKMMGEAEAKKGNKARAADWWRKSFQLYDDPEERAKVARLLQAAR